MKYKTKNILITIVISFIVIVGLYFYYVLKTNFKDVSNKAPYAQVLNKQIITVEDAIYIENSTLELAKEYPNELQNIETIDTSNIKNTVIPKGSILEFQKAVQVNRAVSGSKYSFLLGTISLKGTNEKKTILYHWGTFKDLYIEEPCNYWEYRKAPWQTEIDTKKYFE